MTRTDFEKLVASLKEAGAIRRGECEPARLTRFEPAGLHSVELVDRDA